MQSIWKIGHGLTRIGTDKRFFRVFLLLLGFLFVVVGLPRVGAEETASTPPTVFSRTREQAVPPPTINVPYFDGTITTGERAIFWFGELNNTNNYSDVRVGYNDDELVVQIASFDRRLWFDTTPSLAEIADWDSATLYLSLNGNVGETPSSQSYQFLGMHTTKTGNDHYGVYQGNGANWAVAATNFSINSGTQASGLNDDADDKGWWVAFVVPFSSLGLAGPPAAGAEWGVGIATHDRDDGAGTPIADQVWPDGMTGERPSTWGKFSFGIPTYTPPAAVQSGTAVIRDGENGNSVVDGHGGGHSICGGDDLWPDKYFSDWGFLNYAGYPQINIQNQFNLGDWPCFSKYFVTFPLDDIPAGKVILSAELSMYQFGNAGQGSSPTPQPTLIQVARVDSSFNESTLNWNNAPQVQENESYAWAGTIPAGGGGFFVTWDVSRAVAETVATGQSLRLGLYTADSNRNSGKYFVSSEGAPANPTRRPTLTVIWGDQSLDVTPPVHSIEAGGVATYTISAEGLSGAVTLTTQNPSPSDLQFNLSPTVITSPQTATLTVTDLHSEPLSSGFVYTIPIQATGGGGMLETAVTLFVGGEQIFLPLVNRE